MTDIDYDIQEIDGQSANPSQPKDLATLHAALLGHSPLVLMGPEFIEKFYYTVLPVQRLISGAIAYVDGRAAGFIIVTNDADGFMSRAVKSYWPRICWIMFKSVLRKPSRLLAIKEAYQIQSNVQAEKYGPEVGEMLSFGVLPEFRSRLFVKQTSYRIGHDLLERAIMQMRAAGKNKIRAIVDKDNIEAQLFYRSQGWHVGLSTVKGWRVPTMEFLLDCESVAHH